MISKTLYLSAMPLLALAVDPAAAQAQAAADALPPQLLACAAEVDVMRRLSCYDREMAALRAAPAPLVAAVEPAPDVRAEPAVAAVGPAPERPALPPAAAAEATPARESASPEAAAPGPAAVAAATVAAAAVDAAPKASAASSPESQVRSTPAQAVTPDDKFGREDVPREITAKVVAIRKRPYGEMVILLDNNQIWEQKHLDRRFKLEVGDEVTIRKGAVSGYRLSGRGNNSIQVERRQ